MQTNLNTEDGRLCYGCRQRKPLTEFWPNHRRKDGLMCRCKPCCREQHQRWTEQNKRKNSDGAVPKTKVCQRCFVEKESAEFCIWRGGPDGLNHYCRQCCAKISHGRVNAGKKHGAKRDRNRYYNYGLPDGEFARILERQGGVCAICKTVPRVPTLDHCHRTWRIRGVLCSWCNAMLSGIEREGFVAAALAYLEATKDAPIYKRPPRNRGDNRGVPRDTISLQRVPAPIPSSD